MDRAAVTQLVIERIKELGQAKGLDVPPVTPASALLGGNLPIDSLDLATIVVELEATTGRDPFRDGFIDFRTVEELARLFGNEA
jgi:acyl carrier protein